MTLSIWFSVFSSSQGFPVFATTGPPAPCAGIAIECWVRDKGFYIWDCLDSIIRDSQDSIIEDCKKLYNFSLDFAVFFTAGLEKKISGQECRQIIRNFVARLFGMGKFLIKNT